MHFLCTNIVDYLRHCNRQTFPTSMISTSGMTWTRPQLVWSLSKQLTNWKKFGFKRHNWVNQRRCQISVYSNIIIIKSNLQRSVHIRVFSVDEDQFGLVLYTPQRDCTVFIASEEDREALTVVHSRFSNWEIPARIKSGRSVIQGHEVTALNEE